MCWAPRYAPLASWGGPAERKVCRPEGWGSLGEDMKLPTGSQVQWASVLCLPLPGSVTKGKSNNRLCPSAQLRDAEGPVGEAEPDGPWGARACGCGAPPEAGPGRCRFSAGCCGGEGCSELAKPRRKDSLTLGLQRASQPSRHHTTIQTCGSLDA